MKKSLFLNVDSKTVVLTAIFTVIYILFRMIPTFPILGISGGTFTFADILPPIYALILGPYIGTLTIIGGTFLSFLYGKPTFFLGLDFLPGIVNVMIVGFLCKRKRVIPLCLYTSLLVIFLIHPYTVVFVPVHFFNYEGEFFFAWMHIIALILLISPLSLKASIWVNSQNMKKIVRGIIILSLIGIMGQHLMGNILYENLFGLALKMPISTFKIIWYTIFWIYPFERSIIILIATLIGTPIIKIFMITNPKKLLYIFSK